MKRQKWGRAFAFQVFEDGKSLMNTVLENELKPAPVNSVALHVEALQKYCRIFSLSIH